MSDKSEKNELIKLVEAHVARSKPDDFEAYLTMLHVLTGNLDPEVELDEASLVRLKIKAVLALADDPKMREYLDLSDSDWGKLKIGEWTISQETRDRAIDFYTYVTQRLLDKTSRNSH